MEQDVQRYTDIVAAYATEVGMKILAAIVFWIVGRWLIGLAGRMLQRVLERQQVDPTLMRYIGSFVAVTLNIVLVVAILGYFGVQTTTFAALVAGIGIAIGIDTPDNVFTIVGNGKIFSDTIQNFSTNPFRRVELKCQLTGSVDHVMAMQLLRDRLRAIPNVVAEPAVEVEILEFNLVGPVLAVRPFCHTDHYWQVYFDGNRVMREALAEAGFPPPMPAQLMLTRAA